MTKISSLALDTSAVIDFLRPDRADPPQIAEAQSLYIPLTVVGELLAGAYGSDRALENATKIEDFTASHGVLTPDVATAHIYGRLRAAVQGEVVKHGKINDLWIAALCIQHEISLLTNDHAFDALRELTAIHW